MTQQTPALQQLTVTVKSLGDLINHSVTSILWERNDPPLESKG